MPMATAEYLKQLRKILGQVGKRLVGKNGRLAGMRYGASGRFL